MLQNVIKYLSNEVTFNKKADFENNPFCLNYTQLLTVISTNIGLLFHRRILPWVFFFTCKNDLDMFVVIWFFIHPSVQWCECLSLFLFFLLPILVDFGDWAICVLFRKYTLATAIIHWWSSIKISVSCV